MSMPELDAVISRNLAWAAAEQLTETTAARIQASVAETLALELIRFEAQRIPVPWGLLVRDHPFEDWHEQETEPAVIELTPAVDHSGSYGDLVFGPEGFREVAGSLLGVPYEPMLHWYELVSSVFNVNQEEPQHVGIYINDPLYRLPVQRRRPNRMFPDDRGHDANRVRRATNPHRRETWETITGSGGSGCLVEDLLSGDGPYPVDMSRLLEEGEGETWEWDGVWEDQWQGAEFAHVIFDEA